MKNKLHKSAKHQERLAGENEKCILTHTFNFHAIAINVQSEEHYRAWKKQIFYGLNHQNNSQSCMSEEQQFYNVVQYGQF